MTFYSTLDGSRSKSALNFNRSNFFQKFSKKFSLEEDNLDLIESNPLLYNLSIHPLKKNDEDLHPDQQKLNLLMQIATQKKEETFNEMNMRKKEVKFFNSLKTSKRKANALIKENPIQFFENYKFKNYQSLKII